MDISPFNPRHILIAIVAVFVTFGLHEASHWLAGVLLGYDMTMSLNGAYPIGIDHYDEYWHGTVISAAGPLCTILQATVIFFIMRRKRLPLLFPFLFAPLVMRIAATVVSFRNPNDEARVSSDLGLTMWVLPGIVCIYLFYLVYQICKQYELWPKVTLVTLLYILATMAVIILVIK